MKYGYFPDEQVAAKIKTIKKTVRIKILKPGRPVRSMNQVSLGFHDPGVCLPVVSKNDCYSQVLGVCKRIVPELPIPTVLDEEICCFIDRFCALYFRPLRAADICTPEEWLATRRLPVSRKLQYTQRWAESEHGKHLNFNSKGFEKEETYVDWKFERNIQPLDLAVNMLMGPIEIAIEKQVFALPCFIKKVPEHLRVDHLATQVAGLAQMVVWTDYTSMESAYNKVKFEWHERVDRYMVKDLPFGEEFLRISRATTVGLPRTVVSAEGEAETKVVAPSVLMPTVLVENADQLRSGAVRTSRINAQQNCINRYFILHKFFGIDCLSRDVNYLTPQFDKIVTDAGGIAPAFAPPGIMEGDDGEFMEEKWARTATEHYAALGYKCEPQHGVFGQDGDFLSVYYDQVDMEMLTDVRSVYADLPWGNSDYLAVGPKKKMELARAKALSQLHRLPACPIVTAQALHVLRATKDVKLEAFFERRHAHLSSYELDQMYEAYMYFRFNPIMGRKIGDRSRLMIERYTGVTVDMQIKIETVFNESDELRPRRLLDPLVCPPAWSVCANEYVKGETLEDIRERKTVPPQVPSRFDNFDPEFWREYGDQIYDERGRVGRDAFITRFN